MKEQTVSAGERLIGVLNQECDDVDFFNLQDPAWWATKDTGLQYSGPCHECGTSRVSDCAGHATPSNKTYRYPCDECPLNRLGERECRGHLG